MTELSVNSQEQLGAYVYALVDPRSDKVFYVGKGNGNRVFDHCNFAIKDEDAESLKLSLIREIIAEGLNVKHYILRHKLSNNEALIVESVLIDFLTYPEFNNESMLTNIVSGHHQWDRGIKTVGEIEAIYDCKQISPDPNDHMLLVSLNRTFDLARKRNDDIDLYEITRRAWIVAKNKAKQVNYVLGIHRGIVRSVIKVSGYSWEKDGKNRDRCAFVGELVDDSPYLNKKVDDYPFGSGGAITYINL
ncbi:MAG: endonuclease [Bacteroidales bacterium]|nr:endonuclease [Bacteroidales bacterium]